jgi:hypothetical protein
LSPILTESDSQGDARERPEDSVVSSELIRLGQQSLATVATSVARGAPLVQCQLLATEFYEALKDELRETSPTDVAKRDTLLAAFIQCFRIATASISPDQMLDELRRTIAILQSDGPVSSPIRFRPMLRVIEGGLSR